MPPAHWSCQPLHRSRRRRAALPAVHRGADAVAGRHRHASTRRSPLARHWPAARRRAGGAARRSRRPGAPACSCSTASPPSSAACGTAERPLVLMIEDLHWADPSSRDVLRFLLARLRTEHLLVVGTYRTDDLHRRHPLRPVLAELLRHPKVDHLELPPFTRDELAEFSEAITGRVLPDAALQRVLSRSEGNAYFAQELLEAGPDAAALPGSLADVLHSRLERLDPAVQALARIASVSGRRVSEPSAVGGRLAGPAVRRPRWPSMRPCARPSPITCWGPRTPNGSPSGMPCSPKRSTPTCCPANWPACTAPTSSRLTANPALGSQAETRPPRAAQPRPAGRPGGLPRRSPGGGRSTGTDRGTASSGNRAAALGRGTGCRIRASGRTRSTSRWQRRRRPVEPVSPAAPSALAMSARRTRGSDHGRPGSPRPRRPT